MKLTDYIIVDRNSVLYKAKIELLSSVICFKAHKEDSERLLDNVSAFIEDSCNAFSDTHYSKSEYKSDFCTISAVNNLTANSTYSSVSLANQKKDQLLSKSQLESWTNTQTKACFAVLSTEYIEIKELVSMQQNAHSAKEYAIMLPAEQIRSEIEENDPYKIGI